MIVEKYQIIERLKEVLRYERMHFNYYLQASMEIVGYDRLILKSLIEHEIKSELEHVKTFGNKIVALGGVPTCEAHPFTLTRPVTGKSVLKGAIAMERDILKLYHKFYKEVEAYGEEAGDMSVVLLLEENIEHTTADVEEMEKVFSWL